MEWNFPEMSVGFKTSVSRSQLCYMRYRNYYSMFSFFFLGKDALSAACTSQNHPPSCVRSRGKISPGLSQWCPTSPGLHWWGWTLLWWFLHCLDLLSEPWSCQPWWLQVCQHFLCRAEPTAEPPPPGALGTSFIPTMDFPYRSVSFFCAFPKTQAWQPHSAAYVNAAPERFRKCDLLQQKKGEILTVCFVFFFFLLCHARMAGVLLCWFGHSNSAV